MAKTIAKYGFHWNLDDHPTDLHIEMDCIRKWDKVKEIQTALGFTLAYHYEQMRRILWPKLDDHRWHRLIRDTILANKCTVLAGCASSGKSHEAAWLFLCEYFCFPDETCILVSSTEIRGLRGRIWSEITQFWQQARDKFSWLPGNLLDSRVAILTDALDEDEYDEKRARDYRKCIQGVPCRESGSWVGLNRYAGWKQNRMRLIADEANQMEREYITGITNLNSNDDFKVVILGNFSDPMDCLGRCAEPKDGWGSHMSPMKTEVWKTFYPLEGTCVNLIGFDSPNHDYPKTNPDDPDHFRYMIGPKRISEIEKSFGRESIEFMSQCWGAMKVSTLSYRVLNRQLCERGHAFDDVIWEGTPRTRLAGLDASWGGDRCVFTWVEFGKDVTGTIILWAGTPELVPINPLPGEDADAAIARWVKKRCTELGIPPANFFHDSTGRGSLGTALAREWSAECNPMEFGGKPTQRPVTADYWWYDPQTGERRIKLASEHYTKFVAELWYSVRYCVEAGQLRHLNEEVYDEFATRIWSKEGDKIDLEPKSGTKLRPGMKQRTGRSPDLADSLAIAVEGARRRGFTIAKLENEEAVLTKSRWLQEIAEQHRKFIRKGQLVEV